MILFSLRVVPYNSVIFDVLTSSCEASVSDRMVKHVYKTSVFLHLRRLKGVAFDFERPTFDVKLLQPFFSSGEQHFKASLPLATCVFTIKCRIWLDRAFLSLIRFKYFSSGCLSWLS